MFVHPITGVGAFLASFVVFFQDAESLPLTVFSTDAVTEGLLGIGTAIAINTFRLVGALRSTVSWLQSQF
jgi:hypothetical protein